MKHETYDELYVQFTNALSNLPAENLTPVKLLSESLTFCQEFLSRLRNRVFESVFTETEEIHFFKNIKPKFYAQKIFHLELYGLEMNQPLGTKETLLNYYKIELTYIERFYKTHSAAYHYYRTDGSEMDSSYFVRSSAMSMVQIPEIIDFDPKYSTPMDHLFARFISYKQLQMEILKRIGLLDQTLAVGLNSGSLTSYGLKWTGKIVNLSELIYGLFYTGQLNNGNVQLSEIVALFERMFMVKIRDVHHTFGEIRERKVSSPSKFIDSMATAIRQRVDDDLSYKPN